MSSRAPSGARGRDLGEHGRHVGGRDRLHEQRGDGRGAVLLGPAGHHGGEVVELGRPDDAPRHRAAGDQALLLLLALVVRHPLIVVDAHDGQQDVVPHSRLFLGGEQVLRRRAEEVDDLRLVPATRCW